MRPRIDHDLVNRIRQVWPEATDAQIEEAITRAATRHQDMVERIAELDTNHDTDTPGALIRLWDTLNRPKDT